MNRIEHRKAVTHVTTRRTCTRLTAQSLAACVIAALLIGCGGHEREVFAGTFVPVHLYLVEHPDGLSECQVMEAWDYAQARYDRGGVPVKLVSLTPIRDFPFSNFDDPRYQYNRLDAARKWLRQHNVDTSWSVHFFILPPLICEGGMRCFGGIAERICKPDGGVAIGQGGPWSSHNPPRERISASGLVAAHEIGHLLGATHRSTKDAGDNRNFPPNVMDLAAGRFIDTVKEGLWFLPESVAEMFGCTGFAKKRSIKLCRQNFKRKPVKRRRCVQQVKRRAPVLRSGGAVDEGFMFM